MRHLLYGLLALRPFVWVPLNWLLVTAVFLGASATAYADHPDNNWLPGKAGMALLKPWLPCAFIRKRMKDGVISVAGASAYRPVDELMEQVKARRTTHGVEIHAYEYGHGRWAYNRDDIIAIERGGCNGIAISVEGARSSLLRRVQILAFGTARLPSFAAAATRLGAVVADANDPRVAAARIAIGSIERQVVQRNVVQRNVDDDTKSAAPEESGLLARAEPREPDQAGPPRGCRPTLWTFNELKRVGVPNPRRANAQGERFAAILVDEVRSPSLLRRVDDVELWELRHGFLQGGGLLALYNRKTDRSRWIFSAAEDPDDVKSGFEYKLGDDHFKIIATNGDLGVLLVDTTFSSFIGHDLYAIDLSTATLHKIRGAAAGTGGRDPTFRAVNDGIQVEIERTDGEPGELQRTSPEVIPFDKLRRAMIAHRSKPH